MRKNLNTEHIEGYLYEHDLTVKVTGPDSKVPGTEFITGSIKVAVDENLLNVIPVKFTYVTATNKNGGANKTWTVLKKIIDGGSTVIANGKDAALKVKVDTSIALNDFYKDDELVSAKENNGGFVEIVSTLCDEAARNTFKVDMLIMSVKTTEPSEENHVEQPFVTVEGMIFNFKNDILPVSFRVDNPAGMKYFEDLGVSQVEPLYTQVWGKIYNSTVTKTITEESAFGESAVRTVARTIKNWTITGARPNAYEFGEENVLTMEDIKTGMQNRQTMLAEVKAKRDAYMATRAAAPTQSAFGNAAPAQAAAPTGYTSAPAGNWSF